MRRSMRRDAEVTTKLFIELRSNDAHETTLSVYKRGHRSKQIRTKNLKLRKDENNFHKN